MNKADAPGTAAGGYNAEAVELPAPSTTISHARRREVAWSPYPRGCVTRVRLRQVRRRRRASWSSPSVACCASCAWLTLSRSPSFGWVGGAVRTRPYGIWANSHSGRSPLSGLAPSRVSHRCVKPVCCGKHRCGGCRTGHKSMCDGGVLCRRNRVRKEVTQDAEIHDHESLRGGRCVQS